MTSFSRRGPSDAEVGSRSLALFTPIFEGLEQSQLLKRQGARGEEAAQDQARFLRERGFQIQSQQAVRAGCCTA